MTSMFKYLTYKMASVHACVRACAVEIKPGMLRAACFNDVRVWSRIWFALQDGDFSLQSRVIQYGLLNITNHDLFVVETDIGNTLLCYFIRDIFDYRVESLNVGRYM